MKRMILVCCLCLAARAVYAEDIEGNWIADKKTGCRVWYPYHIFSNNFLADIDEITWSGKCKKGMADGKGTLKGYNNNGSAITMKGSMNAGRCSHDCSVVKCGYAFSESEDDHGYHYDCSETGRSLKYTGELKDNVPHGHGTMIYPENEGYVGNKYTGDWKDGEKNGKGELHFGNGEKYSGEFQDDLTHGHGTTDKYSGEFRYNGQIAIYKNDDSTQGKDWLTDEKTGCRVRYSPASFEFHNSNLYYADVAWSGECKDGKASGKGTLRLYEKKSKELSVTLEGVMQDGQCRRDCSITTKGGDKYLGALKNNAFHGKGIAIYHNGSKYIGEWKNGRRHGIGELISADGTKYIGEWRDDDQYGEGETTSANGAKIKKEGDGKIKTAEGGWLADENYCQVRMPADYLSGYSVSWQGDCKNGKASGRGVLTVDGNMNSPMTITGFMEDGECRHNCLISEEDFVHYGDFEDNAPGGKVTFFASAFGEHSKCIREKKSGLLHTKCITVQESNRYDVWIGYKSVVESVEGEKISKGEIDFAGGSRYIGELKEDNQFHGNGTMIYPNGNIYSGEFRFGMEHGKGTLTSKEGIVLHKGAWEYGEEVNPQQQ